MAAGCAGNADSREINVQTRSEADSERLGRAGSRGAFRTAESLPPPGLGTAPPGNRASILWLAGRAQAAQLRPGASGPQWPVRCPRLHVKPPRTDAPPQRLRGGTCLCPDKEGERKRQRSFQLAPWKAVGGFAWEVQTVARLCFLAGTGELWHKPVLHPVRSPGLVGSALAKKSQVSPARALQNSLSSHFYSICCAVLLVLLSWGEG